jgi:hypothetical protein
MTHCILTMLFITLPPTLPTVQLMDDLVTAFQVNNNKNYVIYFKHCSVCLSQSFLANDWSLEKNCCEQKKYKLHKFN